MRLLLLNFAEGGVVRERLVFAIWLVIIAFSWLFFEIVRPPFIEVDSVTVERSVEGSDPHVYYVRTVHWSKRATWSVEIIGSRCSGTGVHTYEAGTKAFDWRLYADYVYSECSVPAGVYAMRTCYEWLWGLRRHCAKPTVVVVDPLPPVGP